MTPAERIRKFFSEPRKALNGECSCELLSVLGGEILELRPGVNE
jgi:hypothetical protein